MESRGEAGIVSRKEEIEAFFEERAKERTYRAKHFRREDEVSEAYGPDRVFGGSEGMKTPTPKAPSITQQNMSYLEECIDTLFKSAEVLGIRLENILSEGSPEVAADRPNYGGNSPFSTQLAVFCRRLSDLNDRLEYLTARIDL